MRLTVPTSDRPLDPNRVTVADERGRRIERWTIRGIEGDAVPIVVTAPAEPGQILLAAHGLTGSGESPYIAGAAKGWADSGMAVVAPDFPLHGGRAESGSDFQGAQTPEVVRQALGDLWRAVDFAVGRFGDLPIGLVGFSMGAMFGTLYAAQDPRVASLCLVVAGSRARRLRLANPGLPEEALELIEATDPATYAPDVSPRPVLLLCADRDEQFDRISAFDLYDAFEAPKELTFFPGTHAEWPHPGPVYRRITRFLLEAVRPPRGT